MGDIVNLRMARKHKARAEKERTAAENRVLHSRSKSERDGQRHAAREADRFIEGHRLSPARDDKD